MKEWRPYAVLMADLKKAGLKASDITIVTGATSGIGRRTAEIFVREGARVTICARSAGPLEEARALNHNYVGTEHLLLGLLREQEDVAAQVLMNLGLKLEEVREEVLNLLGHTVLGFEQSWAQPLAALATAYHRVGDLQGNPNFPNLGDTSAALANYRKALAIKPDYVEARNNRGSSLLALGRHEEALACFDKVLAARPGERPAVRLRPGRRRPLHRACSRPL